MTDPVIARQRNAARTTSATAGREPQPIDRELALINADVYSSVGSRVGRWSPVPDEELLSLGISPRHFVDERSGFRARLYADGTGRYVLAFCGTNEGRDWRTNIRQGIGLSAQQYEQAVELTADVNRAAGDRLVVTGHSLGGGLAAIAALRFNLPAVTFNAAGVHDNTFERNRLDPDAARAHAAQTGQVRRYTVDNEILTRLQEHQVPTRWLMADGVGHRIRLPDPDPQSFWQRLRPGNGIRHGIDVHSMDAVLRAMDIADERARPAQAPLDTALLEQSLRGVDAPAMRARVPLQDPDAFVNAVAGLAAQARRDGLQRIDHVVASADGRRLFAVEGRLDDPAHRRTMVEVDAVAREPAERSVARLEAAQSDALQASRHALARGDDAAPSPHAPRPLAM